MAVEPILEDFRERVCSAIEIEPGRGLNRYVVHTPFVFDDGDELGIVLAQQRDRWYLTDEGATFWHLTYRLDESDLRHGTRAKIIQSALSAFGIAEEDGELQLEIPAGRYGDALYSFIQGLLKISDVAFLSRERVKSTFLEDLAALLEQAVPPGRLIRNWKDADRDPRGDYAVDWRIETEVAPIFVYALTSDDHTRDATISLHQFENWGLRARGMGVFEDQEGINRRVLARFSDICDKQFSSLRGNEARIAQYVSAA